MCQGIAALGADVARWLWIYHGHNGWLVRCSRFGTVRWSKMFTHDDALREISACSMRFRLLITLTIEVRGGYRIRKLLQPKTLSEEKIR
jgi:hypothetical protein